LAVEAITASIRLAGQVGAGIVVVHAGRVVVNPMLETDLRALYDQGLRGTGEYDDVKAELVEERKRQAERHLDATLWSLDRLATLADSAGVRLGLENRVHYYEIPLPDELDLLLRELAGPVAFCFDTGHAYVLEELGFVSHDEWLTGFSEHIAGVHLHTMCAWCVSGRIPVSIWYWVPVYRITLCLVPAWWTLKRCRAARLTRRFSPASSTGTTRRTR
jgi:sugar phosphate isomerase/epimerase